MNKLYIAIGVIVSILGIYYAGYKQGKANEKIVYQEKIIYKEVENDKVIQEIDKIVHTTSSGDKREWLSRNNLRAE